MDGLVKALSPARSGSMSADCAALWKAVQSDINSGRLVIEFCNTPNSEYKDINPPYDFSGYWKKTDAGKDHIVLNCTGFSELDLTDPNNSHAVLFFAETLISLYLTNIYIRNNSEAYRRLVVSGQSLTL
jgi:hypothetical protein